VVTPLQFITKQTLQSSFCQDQFFLPNINQQIAGQEIKFLVIDLFRFYLMLFNLTVTGFPILRDVKIL
jgi:hypothetical protein